MKIALLCPTKNRLDDVKRLILSIEKTVHNVNNIVLYIGIDADDRLNNIYEDIARFKSYIKIIRLTRYSKFPGLGKIWNYMAREVTEDILAMTGDDFVYETNYWDQTIIQMFQDGPADNMLMVHCNDGLHGPGNRYPGRYIQSVNSFIHRKYHDINGYYLREELKHQFLDTWLDEVYHRLGRKQYRHDIMIRHLHFSISGKVDETTRNLRSESSAGKCSKIYKSLANVREKEIVRLNKYMTSS